MPGKDEAALEGPGRAELAARLRREYEGGAGMVALMEMSGRSYGGVDRLLSEAGTVRRDRALVPPGGTP